MGEPCPCVCLDCGRRSWLLERLAPRLERERARILELLADGDGELMDRLGADGSLRDGWRRFGGEDLAALTQRARCAGLELSCRHTAAFPEPLRNLSACPALLAVNGGERRLTELCAQPRVAIVGTRRASAEGIALAREMGAQLAASGVTVVSGMAFGIDGAAHEGALAGGGGTVAVLAAAPDRPYPATKAALFRQIADLGVVVSEQASEGRTWRWALQARNRIIAGLADLTVLVEGPERSGALITVRCAGLAGRTVAAVPGRVGAPGAAGPNRLLAKSRAGDLELDRERVHAVRGGQDILDLLFGEGERRASGLRPPAPSGAEAELLGKIRAGELGVAGLAPQDLAALSRLELAGWVRRGGGGTITALPP